MNINLQTIIQQLSFWKLDKYAEELNINFSSEDREIQEKFACDFILTFLYQNKYFCYCIVEKNIPETKFTAITVHGHFLYQGNSFHDALGRVAAFYNKFDKPLQSNDPEITEKN